MLPNRLEPMIRVPNLLLTALVLVSSLSAAAEVLPRPAGLEANVRFWTLIYSEIDGQGGFIHDSQNLDAIYEDKRVIALRTANAYDSQIIGGALAADRHAWKTAQCICCVTDLLLLQLLWFRS